MQGCNTVPVSAEITDQLFRRGIVSQGEQGLTFRPCFIGREEQLIDPSGQLQAYLNNSPLPAIYAELSGEIFKVGQPWMIDRVHMLGGNVSCNHELENSQFRAAGEDPLWIADIKDDGIYVQYFEMLTQLVFPLREPVRQGQSYSWQSELNTAGSYNLRLDVISAECRDRYGFLYAYRAEMYLNDQFYIGCARSGNLDLRSLPGLYTVSLESRGGGRYLALEVMSDGELTISNDYRNGQPVILHRGSWQKLGKNRFLFHITENDGKPENELLLFTRDERGGLVLSAFSTLYGGKGLRLEKKGPEQKYRLLSPNARASKEGLSPD